MQGRLRTKSPIRVPGLNCFASGVHSTLNSAICPASSKLQSLPPMKIVPRCACTISASSWLTRDGKLGAAFYVGGGMGRTPMIAPLIKDYVPIEDFLSYAEACLRVYNRYGRRDNIYKARIKILVHEIGADEYAPAG